MKECLQQERIYIHIFGNNELDFDKIIKQIPTAPLSIVQKNESVDFLKNDENAKLSKCDMLLYEFIPSSNEELYETLRRAIKEIFFDSDCFGSFYARIHLSVLDKNARLYYKIPNDVIKLINQIGAKLEISVLSFGVCESDDLSYNKRIKGSFNNMYKSYMLSKYML